MLFILRFMMLFWRKNINYAKCQEVDPWSKEVEPKSNKIDPKSNEVDQRSKCLKYCLF